VSLRLLSLILLSVGLSALAQLLLKMGVDRSGAVSQGESASGLFTMLMSPMVIGGLALYGVGAMVWLFVLGKAPLSLAYPFVGLGFILTAALGIFVLNEGVSAGRIAGTLLIALGCVLVARSA
jgi:multidrug transporter EmrE-like cation transporter